MAINPNTQYTLSGSQVEDIHTYVAAIAAEVGDVETILTTLTTGSGAQEGN